MSLNKKETSGFSSSRDLFDAASFETDEKPKRNLSPCIM
jgi:hypothetical protein